MVTTTRILTTLVAASALAASCKGKHEQQDITEPPLPPTVEQGLGARAVFVRASLDVRGARPSAQELEALAAAPEKLEEMIAALTADPRLGSRVASIFADALRTRQDRYLFDATMYGLEANRNGELQRAIAEEAPSIVQYVTVKDAPFSEILTAKYTVVDPVLLQVWPLSKEPTQPADLPEGKMLARYNDGRPAAGVLSTNSFFWRHRSTVENANRGRANAISRAFLCKDYLDRPIDFPKDVNLTDTESIHQAIKTNSACQACHSTLDPLASHLWGFMHPTDDVLAHSLYHPASEKMYLSQTQAMPAYFGVPTSGRLDGLGYAISKDDRFVTCTVKRVYESFLARNAALADEGQLAAHREAFLASGLSMKALVRSVLKDPAYRGISRVSDFGGKTEGVKIKLASPELLTASIADLSGFVLSVDGRVATEVDRGLRAFAGGSDRGALRTPSAGNVVVHRRLAEAAAQAIVDGRAPKSRLGLLVAKTDLAAAPTAEKVAALILETRSQTVAHDSVEVTSLLSLWNAVAAKSDATDAWSALLTALLADPTLATY
jgi:hypothetical protein